MPEGHTLHRLARLHRRRYGGASLAVSSPQGRFTDGAATVDSAILETVEAYGKHLFYRFEDRGTVHVHLGLYGAFTEARLPVTPAIGQVRMRMIGSTHWTDLRGPTRCELLDEAQVDRVKAGLGSDPLRGDAKPGRVFEQISRSRRPLAVLLMDQSVIAGVGNVYRAEILFRHGIPPTLLGTELHAEDWDGVWTDLVALMRIGVRTGRIDTVTPEHLPEAMGRQPRVDRHGGEVYVYRRSGLPCLVCATPIAHTKQAGRNLYWCPACQST